MALGTMGQNYENNEQVQQDKESVDFMRDVKEFTENPDLVKEVIGKNPDNLDKANLESAINELIGKDTIDAIMKNILQEEGVNEIYENIVPVVDSKEESIVQKAVNGSTESVIQEEKAEVITRQESVTNSSDVIISKDDLKERITLAKKETVSSSDEKRVENTIVERILDGNLDSSRPNLQVASAAFIKAASRVAPDSWEQTEKLQGQKKEISDFMVANVMTPDFANQIASDVLAA